MYVQGESLKGRAALCFGLINSPSTNGGGEYVCPSLQRPAVLSRVIPTPIVRRWRRRLAEYSARHGAELGFWNVGSTQLAIGEIMKLSIVMAGVCLSASFVASAAVPFTFQSGQPARASEVNQNFQNLDQRVNNAVGSVSFPKRTSTGDGIASITCPSASVALSAGCVCDDTNGSRNAGVLFACTIAGNGGIAACFPESGTFNPSKPDPQASITLVCAAVTSGSGSAKTSLPDDSIELRNAEDAARLQLDDMRAKMK